MTMATKAQEIDYFERHLVRVVSALNALGLMLWSTVTYPGKEDVVKLKRRETESQVDLGEAS
jgi:hypothetical protein